MIAILENFQRHDGTVEIPRRCNPIWAAKGDRGNG